MTYPVAMRTADWDDASTRGRTTSTVAAAVGRRSDAAPSNATMTTMARMTKSVVLRRGAGCARFDLSILSLLSSLERLSIGDELNSSMLRESPHPGYSRTDRDRRQKSRMPEPA